MTNIKERLKVSLLLGSTVTQAKCLKWWNHWRLAVLINRLRNDGYPIQTEMVRTKSGRTYAKYFISKQSSNA